MKIRSVTYFCDPKFPLDETVLRAAGEFLARAKAAFESAGYEVQTTRLATIPFPKLIGDERETPRLARDLATLIRPTGIDYASLGPASPAFPRSYESIPEAIASSENIFFSGAMTDGRRVSMDAVNACARIIVQCAPIEPNGFANLRFAALANVPAHSPFFPAAYHAGGKPAFAVATEAADLAVSAFETAKTFEEGQSALVFEIEKHGRTIAGIAKTLDCDFAGIDFSLAPFPEDKRSLGGAVEKMGVSKIGLHGSLASAAILTEAIERADFPHAGFSGFMQPVLEDSVLAKRAAEGTLTIKDLLLYSSVCGAGLDTVPLPGDIRAERLAPLLLDLCALALRLDKPLTARLLPVPNKKAGDPTAFDFGFFANGKVMDLNSEPLLDPIREARFISFPPRRSHC